MIDNIIFGYTITTESYHFQGESPYKNSSVPLSNVIVL